MEPQIVEVDYSLHTLRDFNVNSRVVNKNPGVHKIRLPLNLTASQTRQQAIRLDQPHACLRQPNSISNPKRELSANKVRIVEDSIEARGTFVSWITIALRPKERTLETKIVPIDRRLYSREVGSHLHSTTGDLISLVMTKREVVRV